MTDEMINKYISKMDQALYDAVLEMLENHPDVEVAKHFNIPVEVAEDLAWYWVED